jgi:hypothetical protein
MDPALFDELQQILETQGADAAIARLCDRLTEQKDYHSLFYAILMDTRHRLGVNPLPTGSYHDLPKESLPSYEEAIRSAGRHVGNLYLKEGQLPQAYSYFRMLNEPEPVRNALEDFQPGAEEDIQPIVQIAFYEGVHPRKGFDWILSRYGLCSAITTLSSQDLQQAPEVRQYCIQRLVRALYAELRERLAAEIERHEDKRPVEADAPADAPGAVRKMIVGRNYLFADDSYHIDVSHLSSVVQMSVSLQPCAELDIARELCEYGRHLTGRFTNAGDPPFEDLYKSHGAYLAILAGDDVERNLDFFREQAANADPQTVGTYPAEVLVNLLLRLQRPAEALAVARKYLVGVDNRQLTCPSVSELCQKVSDYRALADVAREQGDPVHFMAGLLAAGKQLQGATP